MSDSDAMAPYQPLDAATRAALYAGARDVPKLDVPLGPGQRWRLPFRAAIPVPERVQVGLQQLLIMLQCGFEYEPATRIGYLTAPASENREQDLQLLRDLATGFVEVACRFAFELFLEDIKRTLESDAILSIGDIRSTSASKLADIAAKGIIDVPEKILHNIVVLQDSPSDVDHESESRESGSAEEFEVASERVSKLREAVLGRLVVAQEEFEEAKSNLDRKVLDARAVGATWTEIGRTIGISQQAANQRWGKKAKEAAESPVPPT